MIMEQKTRGIEKRPAFSTATSIWKAGRRYSRPMSKTFVWNALNMYWNKKCMAVHIMVKY